MVERLGEMRKGRRERIKKGSREGIEKETEEKEGLREPPLLEFLDPTLCCSHCFFKYQNLFLQAYRKHYLKHKSWCETECKKCAIGETECNET